jgi:hypothetical protein
MILSDEELTLLNEKFLPLGQIPKFDPVAKSISLTNTTARRFLFDGNYVNRTKKSDRLSNLKKFDPTYLGFGFFETLSIIMQDNYDLYQKLFEFFDKIDLYASTIFPSCSNAVITFSNKSFGDRLFPHIHQEGTKLPTMSLFFNLTNLDVAPFLTFFDTLEEDNKIYDRGYTDHKLLLVHERKSKNVEHIPINNNMCILFDAYKIPHAFSYTNDLWATVVYDHVNSNIALENKGRYHVGTIRI